MPSFSFQHAADTSVGRRVLWDTDRRGGFEGDFEVDVFAVGDAALDTAGKIGGGGHGAVDGDVWVVVDVAGYPGAGHARSDLKAFRGGDGEHRMCQLGLQPVR